MAHNLKLSDVAANAGLDGLTALLNGGSLTICDGAQPANANAAVTTQHVLSTVTFGSPAFANAVGGVAAAHALGADPAIARAGTATWARAYKADGVTVVCDVSVGTAGCDINLNSTALQQGAPLAVTALTLTLPE